MQRIRRERKAGKKVVFHADVERAVRGNYYAWERMKDGWLGERAEGAIPKTWGLGTYILREKVRLVVERLRAANMPMARSKGSSKAFKVLHVGGEDDFAKLLYEFEPLLQKLIQDTISRYPRALSGSDRDDLRQVALLKLWFALPQFDRYGPATFTTWAYAVARNAMIDYARQRKKGPLGAATAETGQGLSSSKSHPPNHSGGSDATSSDDHSLFETVDLLRRVPDGALVFRHVLGLDVPRDRLRRAQGRLANYLRTCKLESSG